MKLARRLSVLSAVAAMFVAAAMIPAGADGDTDPCICTHGEGSGNIIVDIYSGPRKYVHDYSLTIAACTGEVNGSGDVSLNGVTQNQEVLTGTYADGTAEIHSDYDSSYSWDFALDIDVTNGDITGIRQITSSMNQTQLTATWATVSWTYVPVECYPQSVQDCNHGGWAEYTDPAFKNQGDCVSWVVTNGENPPALEDGDLDDDGNNHRANGNGGGNDGGDDPDDGNGGDGGDSGDAAACEQNEDGTFKNHGDCVSHDATGGENPPALEDGDVDEDGNTHHAEGGTD